MFLEGAKKAVTQQINPITYIAALAQEQKTLQVKAHESMTEIVSYRVLISQLMGHKY